jgi:hypothetical protein
MSRQKAHPLICEARTLTRLRNRGSISSVQPSARFAFAFEAPRASVPIMTAVSPPIRRASQTGTWRGGLAPSASATTGSHSRTGAGSSSTMLWIAGPSCSSASTVAAAASSRWIHENTPPPSPTIGNCRLRTGSINPSLAAP